MVDLEDLSENDTVHVDTGGVEFTGDVNAVKELGVEFEDEDGDKRFIDFNKDPDLEMK